MWPGKKNCLQGERNGAKPKPKMTPPADRNQFVTQMFFNFSAAILPHLVQKREFTDLKELNAEMVEGIEDLWNRYEALTRDTVNLSVAGPLPNQVSPFPRPR